MDPDNLNWRLAPDSPVSHMGAYADGGGWPEPVGTISPLAVPEAACNGIDACLSVEKAKIGTKEPRVDGIELLEVTSVIEGEEHVSLHVPLEDCGKENHENEDHEARDHEKLRGETVVADCVHAPVTIDTSGSQPIQIGDVFGAYTVTDVVKSYDDAHRAKGNDLEVRGTFDAIWPIDPTTEDVILTIDDGSGHTIACTIPAGSFEVDGNPEKHKFKFEGTVDGMDVKAKFKGTDYKIKVKGVSNTYQLVGTTMTIDLRVGLGFGLDTIVMEDKNNHLKYKTEAEADCCGGLVQPIEFSHAEHMEEHEANLTCQDCHTTAATQAEAGLPGKATCLACHDGNEGGGHHHEIDELAPYTNTDEEIPWVNVSGLRSDVSFSHGVHGAGSQIDCLYCHPGQASRSRPRWRDYTVMRMGECRNCHQGYQARNDCQACHEPGSAW